MDLFADQRTAQRERVQPLAVRMRPRTLDEFVGQESFIGEGKLLRRMIEADRISSAVFYGPAGTGKTSLANIIAAMTRSVFEPVNAAAVGVKDIRDILGWARDRLETSGQRTILFVDEIHRFNRAQQDVLLDDVESGRIILLGATTENPFFALTAPLISRSQIFQFEPLSTEAIGVLVRRAASDPERGLGTQRFTLTDEAVNHWATLSDGDARRALSALEVAVRSQWERRGRAGEPGTGDSSDSDFSPVIDLAIAVESIQRKAIRYDREGDAHYDAISAMIKSIRGSDPDAAVYWLARMLEGGEDPRYLARRIVISAAEDVGNAEPRGLVLAQSAADAALFIGQPECQLPLAQAVIFLACAPKSNACAMAVWSATDDVRRGRTLPVPRSLRATGYAGASRLGSGVEYQYPHDSPGGIVAQDYLGVDKRYYVPTDRGEEATIGRYLEEVRRQVRNPDP